MRSAALPDDFARFWKKHRKLCACLQVSFRARPTRFLLDPPEMLTVMLGNTDGLHWGYWFDDPDDAAREPVVASFYSNDAFEITEHATLFEALRHDLELSQRDAEQYKLDDPDHAADYDAQLVAYARLRAAIGEFAPGRRRRKKGRVVTAPTRHRMGIVVRPDQYRPLAARDPFARWDYRPELAEVKKMAAKARALADDGAPGAALKLGHDLWGYGAFLDESAALLDLAYERLGRTILRRYLAKAVQLRRRSVPRPEARGPRPAS
jgi:hypothetical protein